jgi:hypothetical protein
MDALEKQSSVTMRIDDTFRSAQQTMDWIASKLKDISVGALLMGSNLPPELFQPTATSCGKRNTDVSQVRWDLTPSL